LQKRLDVLKIVDRPPSDTSRVYFGARVRLESETGDIAEYRIVGPDELDPGKGHISIDSPLARALLKKTVDDEVAVALPRGRTLYTILEISYPPADAAG
jgi:transcription elongation factor GreB